jgi:large subunit ribosomal protein L3
MTKSNQKVEALTIDLPAFFGVKAGMTRVFDEMGNHLPVTVIKIIPNFVSQIKTNDKDGYSAYQVAYYEKREKLINNPTKVRLKNANIKKFLCRFSEVKVNEINPDAIGSEVTFGEFPPNSFIDVTAVTKGKGFQGVVKKYNFAGGPATHGSHFHRRPGSIGNRATPARVFRGKKMPGQLGGNLKTIQNLKIHEINLKNGYILIRGSVPGCKNGFVKISKPTKK